MRESALVVIRQEARDMGWRIGFVTDKATVLSGIAEANETFFLESLKDQRKLSRPARKRGWKSSKTWSFCRTNSCADCA